MIKKEYETLYFVYSVLKRTRIVSFFFHGYFQLSEIIKFSHIYYRKWRNYHGTKEIFNSKR